MATRLQKIEGDESVLLRVTHSNLKTFSADIRFSLQSSVESVKDKLWRKCGTSVDSMSLHLYDDSNTQVSILDDNSKPLGFYSPHDGYRLHVIDLDPSSVTSGGWLEDTSLVEKYTISQEAYEKRDGTFRKFKDKLASHNPSTVENKIPENYMEDLHVNIKVGDRCEVQPGDKRGVVKYVGRAESLAPGFWIGVQYDEPLGKHDGMVKGTRYFNCPPLHGGMVRPDKVKVGDYPERDPFEEDEI
ncbi:PREDICTED: tubulin-folding cofactor B-like [Prunus mume]|uniref:Tubulin-folding cofactor B-like n=1 Tax=Prunus mume TaxID=102107 RepID=A0ABM0NCV0_PRUMU|nr:PREDICTED: tubulin-folding cofactor B-like [Prunus mume]